GAVAGFLTWGGGERFPPIIGYDRSLTDDVPLDLLHQLGAGQSCWQVQLRVEGVYEEVVVVQSAGGRSRATVDRPPPPILPLHGPFDLLRHRSVRVDRQILGETARAPRDVVDHPVNPRRRVSGAMVLTDYRDLPGSRRQVPPRQRW